MGGRCLQLTAMLLAIMAALSLGLGVANVIAVYYFVYSETRYNCLPNLSATAVCPYRNVITLAFIGSGIWGSLVVFAVSILAIRSVAKQFAYRTMLQTALFITSVIIIPTMIVLNAVEVALLTTENAPNMPVLFNESISSNNSIQGQLLFALPICVSSVGFLEWLLMAGIFVYTFLCLKEKPASKEPTEEAPKPAETQPAPAQPAPPAQPPIPGAEPPSFFFPGPGQGQGYPQFGPSLYGPSPYGQSPYGPSPYRRPGVYGMGDYGRFGPTSAYRPGLRSPYTYGAGLNPMPRAYPLSYVPPGY